MDVPSRDRDELKTYFVKNAIPTEGNFAELIDGMLNQKSDGLVKLPNDPLSIEAAGDPSTKQPAIHFYGNIEDSTPEWKILLNAATGANSKPGFHIVDGNDSSRLFVDKSSGNVGIGVKEPKAKLHIDGDIKFSHFGKQIRFVEGRARSTFGAVSYTALQLGFPAPAYGGHFKIGTWSATASNDEENEFIELMRVKHNGNVGIGTDDPKAKLHVVGGTAIIQQESWKQPSLQNGWSRYHTWPVPQFFKDSSGVVHLRGLVAGGRTFDFGDSEAVIFQLPEGYRPHARGVFAIVSNNKLGRCDVDSSGHVRAVIGESSWFSLDGISFRSA